MYIIIRIVQLRIKYICKLTRKLSLKKGLRFTDGLQMGKFIRNRLFEYASALFSLLVYGLQIIINNNYIIDIWYIQAIYNAYTHTLHNYVNVYVNCKPIKKVQL
jgi:hypothetical protein